MEQIEEQLLGLKRRVEALEKLRDRALWEKEQVEREAKDMGVKSPEDARKKAAKAEKEAAKLAEEFWRIMKETEEKYGELLGLVKP